MKIKNSPLIDFASAVFFSYAGCIVVGYIFFQELVFNSQAWTFQFVIQGLFGALFIVYMQRQKSKQFIFFLLIVFIDLILFEKTFLLWFILRDIFFNFSLFLSVSLYLILINKNKSLVLFLRAFGFSMIYAFTNVLVGLLLITLHNAVAGSTYEYSLSVILIYAQSGALIGLGLGLGFDLWEVIKKTKLVKAAD